MTQFYYKARNRQSQVVEKKLEAENRAQVVQMLVRDKLTPIVIKEVGAQKKGWDISGPGSPRIKKSELIIFTRQLASIMKCGISLLDSLELLEKQMSPRASMVLKKVGEQIKEGHSLSDALGEHPEAFNDVYVNMVRVGESGGILTEVLDRMASLLEYTEENRRRIKAALRYPKIVMVVMILVFFAIVTFVVPKFSGVFASFDAELPLPTRILIGANDLISGYWFIIFPLVLASYVAFRWWRHGPGRPLVDEVWLKMPVFGILTLKSDISRFARFFASLYRSGIPISDALEMSAKIVDNSIVSNRITEMRTSAVHGKGLTAPLIKTKTFPDLAVQMISIGENTGAISDMFDRLAGYYEREVDHSIKNMTTLVEPFLIVGLGAMVLLIALGVFLPMWNIMNVFRGKM